MIMVLNVKDDETEIHGFLSIKSMDFIEFGQLFRYLKKILKTNYIVGDVLLEHSKVYKRFLKCVDCKKIKSFDGLDCERLKIDIRSKLKPFQSV